MAKIKYVLEIGYAGCSSEGVMEVDDSMTQMQITEMVNDMALEYASSWEGDSRLCWDDDMSEDEREEATESFYENVYGAWDFEDDTCDGDL